jgi:hypothetical protein
LKDEKEITKKFFLTVSSKPNLPLLVEVIWGLCGFPSDYGFLGTPMLLQYTCTIKSDNNPSICFFQSQPALDAVSLAAVLNDTLNMDYIIDMHKRSLNSLV